MLATLVLRVLVTPDADLPGVSIGVCVIPSLFSPNHCVERTGGSLHARFDC
jgi:hypothetical protein